MFQKLNAEDWFYHLSRNLFSADEQSRVDFALIQTNAKSEELLEGLQQRLKVRGPIRGYEIGLVQTIERLKGCAEVDVISANTTTHRGVIYCDLQEAELVGLTLSEKNDPGKSPFESQ